MDAGYEQRFSRTFALKGCQLVAVRSAGEDDVEDMSRIAYEVFFRFNMSKGLKVPFPPCEECDLFKGYKGRNRLILVTTQKWD